MSPVGVSAYANIRVVPKPRTKTPASGGNALGPQSPVSVPAKNKVLGKTVDVSSHAVVSRPQIIPAPGIHSLDPQSPAASVPAKNEEIENVVVVSAHAAVSRPQIDIPTSGAHAVDPQSPVVLVPAKNETLEKAIRAYIDDKLSAGVKNDFIFASDIMEKLQEMQYYQSGSDGKTHISSSICARVKQVLECLRDCIRYTPEISSLVIGGVNCILAVRTRHLRN